LLSRFQGPSVPRSAAEAAAAARPGTRDERTARRNRRHGCKRERCDIVRFVRATAPLHCVCRPLEVPAPPLISPHRGAPHPSRHLRWRLTRQSLRFPTPVCGRRRSRRSRRGLRRTTMAVRGGPAAVRGGLSCTASTFVTTPTRTQHGRPPPYVPRVHTTAMLSAYHRYHR